MCEIALRRFRLRLFPHANKQQICLKSRSGRRSFLSYLLTAAAARIYENDIQEQDENQKRKKLEIY